MRGSALAAAVTVLVVLLVFGGAGGLAASAGAPVGGDVGASYGVSATGTGAAAPGAPATVPSATQPAPKTLFSPKTVTLDDDGATLVLPVGGSFLLELGGPPPDWRVRVGNPAVLALQVHVPVLQGAQAIYRGVGPGVTTLAATSVYPCQEAHPACRVVSRAFRLAVVVRPADAVAFSDVPNGHWASGDVAALVAAGVAEGFPDGTFRPEEPVTRAQFVKMLLLAVGLRPSGTGHSAFKDVPASEWYAPYVTAGAQAGIVQGLSPTTFEPDQLITREQMAVLLTRALRLTSGASPVFSDAARIDDWAQAGVQAAVSVGYVDGFPDGTFQPHGTATRAQAARVVAMLLEHGTP